MKNRIFTIISLMVFGAFSATAQGYSFQTLSIPYSDLSGDISLNQGMVWDDPEYPLTIGFNFPFYGSNIDSLFVSDFGVMIDENSDTLIATYGGDLLDRGYNTGTSLSSISYKLEGSNPNQILKIQWKNVGFYNEDDVLGTMNWYANIQLWLYQDGKIEVRFGPNMVGDMNIAFDGETGAIIGFGEEDDSWFLTGSPAAPTFQHFTNGNYGTLVGVPTDGIVYQFNPSGVGLAEIPSHSPIELEYTQMGITVTAQEPAHIELLNLAGQKLSSHQLEAGETLRLNYGSLPVGIYLLSANTEGHSSKVEKVFFR